MRIQQLFLLSGLMLASNLALGNTLDSDDVPNRCWKVCGSVVGISHKCDAMHDDDAAETKCICEWQQAPTLIPLCEACISQYRNETHHDDDRDNGRDNDRDNDRDDDRDNDHDDDNDDNDDDNDNDRDNNRNSHTKRTTCKHKRDDPHDNDANDILRACSFTTTSYNPTAATSAISAASTVMSSTSATATGSSTGPGSGSSSGSSDASSSSGSASAVNADTNENAAPGAGVPGAASMAAVVGLMGLVWL